MNNKTHDTLYKLLAESNRLLEALRWYDYERQGRHLINQQQVKAHETDVVSVVLTMDRLMTELKNGEW